MSTTRFVGGVTNAKSTDTMGLMGQLDPTKFHTYFNDFDTVVAGDWTVTKVGTGTNALTAGDGGLLLLTNTAAAPDSIAYQLTPASFTFTAGKQMFFKIGFQISDAVQSRVQAGLIITDTTPEDATDGIYFLKPDETANIGVFVRKDATTGSLSNTNVGTLVANTMTNWGFAYDGKETVTFYVNDRAVGSLPITSVNAPDTNLCLSFFIGNGEAVAKTMTVDYVFAAKER